MKLINDEIDPPVADMCFSNTTKTHFVYKMNHLFYFKDLFGSISEYGKKLKLMFLFQNHIVLLHECGLLKIASNRLCKEF